MPVWIVTISGVFYGVYTDSYTAKRSADLTYKNLKNGAKITYTNPADSQWIGTATNGDVLVFQEYLPDSVTRILQGF